MDGGEALVPSSVFKASEADVGGVEAVEDSTVEAKALDTTDDPDVLLDLTESGLLVALVVSAFLLSVLLLLWSGLLSMLRIAEANLVEALGEPLPQMTPSWCLDCGGHLVLGSGKRVWKL
jgi:hypothetical protein